MYDSRVCNRACAPLNRNHNNSDQLMGKWECCDGTESTNVCPILARMCHYKNVISSKPCESAATKSHVSQKSQSHCAWAQIRTRGPIIAMQGGNIGIHIRDSSSVSIYYKKTSSLKVTLDINKTQVIQLKNN